MLVDEDPLGEHLDGPLPVPEEVRGVEGDLLLPHLNGLLDYDRPPVDAYTLASG